MIQDGGWQGGQFAMPRPLSMDMRERLVEAVNSGRLCKAVAKRFAIAPSSVIKLMQAYRETGSFAPKRMGGHWPEGRDLCSKWRS